MPKLADLHNHALYGVDDGARTLADTEAMLAVSYAEGVRALCLTPHAGHPRFHEASEVQAHYRAVQQLCLEKFPELTLYLGSELYGYRDCLDRLVAGRYHPLGNGSAVLVEFDLDVAFREMCNFFLACRGAGYYPVLAHAERYECLSQDIGHVQELSNMRVMIQINASSIPHRLFASRHARLAHRMMEVGLVDIVASDAHDVKRRPPQLLYAYQTVEKQYGAARAARLFYETPQRLLAGEQRKERL